MSSLLPSPTIIVTFLDYDSSLLLSPCSHLYPRDPILHAVEKGIFIKDKPKQVAPWLKLSLVSYCTLNKTHLLSVAPKTLHDLSPSNLSAPLSSLTDLLDVLNLPTLFQPQSHSFCLELSRSKLKYHFVREDFPGTETPIFIEGLTAYISF